MGQDHATEVPSWCRKIHNDFLTLPLIWLIIAFRYD